MSNNKVKFEFSSDSPIASSPAPPYYSVIFTSRRADSELSSGSASENDPENSDYDATAKRMLELAAQQDGYLGVESVRDSNGVGITVSYWRDLDSIHKWHEVAEHKEAQSNGRSKWYDQFAVRICRVERQYSFDRN